MLKYYDYAITFAEFPDEIALCVNISNCPGHCSHCSEPWLLEDVGIELTEEEIDNLISQNSSISLFGFMGGDRDQSQVAELTEYIHNKYPLLKVGMYSGQEMLNLELLNVLDYYKIGRWIQPEGKIEDWWKTNCGPLVFPFSNQLMFKREKDCWINITNKFRSKPLNNLDRYIQK